MSQGSVYNILKNHKNKWFTAKSISAYLKISVNSVRKNLVVLRKTGDAIIRREQIKSQVRTWYKYNGR